MFKHAKNKKGFTLIELIVVVAILAILAVIAVQSFSGLTKDAEDAATLSNAKMIAQAINVHNALNPNGIITDKSEAKGTVGVNLWPQISDPNDESNALGWVTVDPVSGMATAAQPATEEEP